MTYTTFEDWFDEVEGCGLRCERLLGVLGTESMHIAPELREWLVAAFEAGREAAAGRVATLEVTVSGAAAKFREYEKLHAAKPDMVKAKANGDFAASLESVLDPRVIYLTVACDPSKLPPVKFDPILPGVAADDPIVLAARAARQGLLYPADGGLKPQVRDVEETLKMGEVLRREFEREGGPLPTHLRAVDPRTLRDPKDADVDALRERVSQHAADLKALLGIEHEARVLRRLAVEIAEERDVAQARVKELEERLRLPEIEARITELDERVRAILAEHGPVRFDMETASALADRLIANPDVELVDWPRTTKPAQPVEEFLKGLDEQPAAAPMTLRDDAHRELAFWESISTHGSAAQAVLDAAGGDDAQDRG